MVFDYCDHTAERGIPCPFAQPVDRGMHTMYPSPDSRVDISNRQVIIVMGMKIEMQVGITVEHLLTELVRIARIQDAQCIRQHETTDRQVFQRIDQLEYIIGGVFDSVRPVFQINIYINTFFGSQRYNRTDICNMLFIF